MLGNFMHLGCNQKEQEVHWTLAYACGPSQPWMSRYIGRSHWLDQNLARYRQRECSSINIYRSSTTSQPLLFPKPFPLCPPQVQLSPAAPLHTATPFQPLPPPSPLSHLLLTPFMTLHSFFSHCLPSSSLHNTTCCIPVTLLPSLLTMTPLSSHLLLLLIAPPPPPSHLTMKDLKINARSLLPKPDELSAPFIPLKLSPLLKPGPPPVFLTLNFPNLSTVHFTMTETAMVVVSWSTSSHHYSTQSSLSLHFPT